MNRFHALLSGAFALGLTLTTSQAAHAQARALAKPGDIVTGLGPIAQIVDAATFSKDGSAFFLADVTANNQIKKVLVKRSADGILTAVIVSGETSVASDFGTSMAPANAKVILGTTITGQCGYQSEPPLQRRAGDLGDLLLLANISGTGITQPLCSGNRLMNAGNATSLVLVKPNGIIKVLARQGAPHPENSASLINRPYLDSAYGMSDNVFIPQHSEAIVHISGNAVAGQAVGGPYFVNASGQLSPWMRNGTVISNLPGWTIQGAPSVVISSSTSDDLTYPMNRFSDNGNFIVRKVKLKQTGSSSTANAILRLSPSSPNAPLLVVKQNDFLSVRQFWLPGTNLSSNPLAIDNPVASFYHYHDIGRFSVMNSGTVLAGALRAREVNGRFEYTSATSSYQTEGQSSIRYALSNTRHLIPNSDDVLIPAEIFTDSFEYGYPAVIKWSHDDQVSVVYNGLTETLPGPNDSSFRVTTAMLQLARTSGYVSIPFIFDSNSQGNFAMRLSDGSRVLNFAVINGQKHFVGASGISLPSNPNEIIRNSGAVIHEINDENRVLISFATETSEGSPVSAYLAQWSASNGIQTIYAEQDELESGEAVTAPLAPPPYGYSGTTLGMENRSLKSGLGIVGMATLVNTNQNIVIKVETGSAAPVCAADFNQDGTVSIQDIFDYLTAYHSQSASADMNGSHSVSVQDLLDFISIYQNPC